MLSFLSKSPRPDAGEPRLEVIPAVVPGGSPPVIELAGVSRTFDSDPPVRALREVNFAAEQGELVAIVGRSGSGKSTLLNILGLLDVPTAGTYRFMGMDTGRLDDGARSGLRGRSIGFVFQAFHLVAFRPALENVMMAELYNGRPGEGRRERAMAALTRVGLADRAHFLPTRLSGGERQRVAVARALVCRPQLLLCDEPTGNLDSETSDEILALLHGLADDGATVLVITHDDSIARRAQRIVRMADGMLDGPLAAPRSQERALEAGAL